MILEYSKFCNENNKNMVKEKKWERDRIFREAFSDEIWPETQGQVDTGQAKICMVCTPDRADSNFSGPRADQT